MSFILDALRKSESERQRGSVPGIAHVPLAVARPSLPAWAIAVMTALGASVVLMAGAWWLALDARDERAAVAEAPARTALALPPAEQPSPARLPPAAAPPESREDAALRAAVAAPPASALQRSAAEGAMPRVAAAAVPRDASSSGASAAPARTIAADLPSAADLLARGEDLPNLRLELHVFAATSADRYVFINGKMYREGDTLLEGPELVQIDQRGAALRHRGREFLLTQ